MLLWCYTSDSYQTTGTRLKDEDVKLLVHAVRVRFKGVQKTYTSGGLHSNLRRSLISINYVLGALCLERARSPRLFGLRALRGNRRQGAGGCELFSNTISNFFILKTGWYLDFGPHEKADLVAPDS